MKEHLFKMIFYFETGAISEFEIIQWAMNQVIDGNESDSIIQLVSLTRNEKNEVRFLLEQAIKDLGLDYPSRNALGYYRAKLVSEEMIKGKLLPVKGCSIIGRICSDLEWPEILSNFGLINHKLTGHENLGITEDELAKDIISCAYKLIDNVNAHLNLE